MGTVQRIADLVAAEDPAYGYAGLFSENTTFGFGGAMRSVQSQVPQRHMFSLHGDYQAAYESWSNSNRRGQGELAKNALNHLWRAADNGAAWYRAQGLTLLNNPDLAQFIEMIEDKDGKQTFVVHQDSVAELRWFTNYLARVYSSFNAASIKDADIEATVLIRPVVISGKVSAYYVCPVHVTTSVKAWADCGFRVLAYSFHPLNIASPQEFLDLYKGREQTFDLPAELQGFPYQRFARFWAACANEFDNAAKKDPPAAGVPQQQINFDGVSGSSVTIVTGAGSSLNTTNTITPPEPLAFPDPFSPEALKRKFTLTGDPGYFGDQMAVEPKDKLIAALGTAAAAAITIGVASYVS